MSPHEVIDAYVNDVAARLPRAKRNDVAMELNALLQEELQGKADESGRAADEAMALELVRAFGSPEKVADRYRTPSFTIIPPTGTNQFVALALGGLGLQWLVTLPPAWQHAFIPGREFVSIGAWWTSHGLGAFWWPGFMVVLAIIASWVREKRGAPEVSQWRPVARTPTPSTARSGCWARSARWGASSRSSAACGRCKTCCRRM